MSMSMPGFTAELSLSDGRVRGRGTPTILAREAKVQPASLPRIQLNPVRVGPVFRRPLVFDPCYWRRRCQNIYDPRPEFPNRVLFTHCWIERVCP
jgi:hypothetical protein